MPQRGISHEIVSIRRLYAHFSRWCYGNQNIEGNCYKETPQWGNIDYNTWITQMWQKKVRYVSRTNEMNTYLAMRLLFSPGMG